MPLTVYFKSSSHMTFFFVIKVRNIVFDSELRGVVFFKNTYLKYKDYDSLSTHMNRLVLVYI